MVTVISLQDQQNSISCGTDGIGSSTRSCEVLAETEFVIELPGPEPKKLGISAMRKVIVLGL